MRLTKVRVTKLFGLFDHEIPLNGEERITIIHGPNGFGKTIVLRMIEALLSKTYDVFREIPFGTFAIELDDGKCLEVEPREEEDSFRPQSQPQKKAELQFSLSSPDLAEPLVWVEYLKENMYGAVLEFKPDLDVVLSDSPRVRLVRTQRLAAEELFATSAVTAYSKEISFRIAQTLAEYASRSQELDRTFPSRLFNEAKSELPAAEELRKRLSELEQKRATLTGLGFLEPEQGLAQAPVQVIETKRDVLSIYVDDMENKLAVFDEMASKIQLFIRIINDRFLFKRLEIHRDQGFVFTSAADAQLKPSALSSGEQHELILFYELLFKLQKNALVLIDEPEISLHVAWQEKFLGDLAEVVRLSEIDVVVATHSPEIIGDHWDLTVELKGPSEIHKD
jgi:predicted ATP-binding protein involved in virulence